MRAVWGDQVLGEVRGPGRAGPRPELAYTTVMTTLTRLARKGLVKSETLRSRWTGRRALRRFGAGRLRSPARGAQPRSAGAQEAVGKATMSVRRLALTAASIPALCGVLARFVQPTHGRLPARRTGLATLLPVPSA